MNILAGDPHPDRHRVAANEPIRTRYPEELSYRMSVSTLLAAWLDAGRRIADAEHGLTHQPVNVEDLFTELAIGSRIAEEVTMGRWVVVAKLLRLGAVDSWATVGRALGMTETDAHDGFAVWIRRQIELYRRYDRFGISDAEADELHRLAEAVTL